MSKMIPFKKEYLRVLAIVLIVAAAVMLFLAYQSVNTEHYKIYDSQYNYYLTKAAECHELQNGDLGSHYAYLAGEWEQSAKTAGDYLTEHRVGAIALSVVSVVFIGLGVKLLLPGGKKRKEKE